MYFEHNSTFCIWKNASELFTLRSKIISHFLNFEYFFLKSKSIRRGNVSPFQRSSKHPNPIKTRKDILKLLRGGCLIMIHSLDTNVPLKSS